MASDTCSILVVPNEDGFGPSTFAFYVVKELIHQWTALQKTWGKYLSRLPQPHQDRLKAKWGTDSIPALRVVFRNSSRETYLRALFPTLGANGDKVQIETIDNIIRLGKRRGELGFENTLDNLLSYPKLSKIYQKLPFPDGCVGVIDVGVPQVSAAARTKGIPAVTVFDHAWGCSMREIFKSFAETERYAKGEIQPSNAVSDAIEILCSHEAMTDIVFLFPTYITPEKYYHHWHSIGVTIAELGGVLGGRPYVIDGILERIISNWKQVRDSTHEAVRTALEKALEDQRYVEEVSRILTLPIEEGIQEGRAVLDLIESEEKTHRRRIVDRMANGKAEAAFRRSVAKRIILEYKKDPPVVYVSGGGTAVWDELWEKILKGAIEQERTNQLKFALVLCFYPKDTDSVKRLGITELKKANDNNTFIEMKIPVIDGKPSDHIRFVRNINGGTHQEIFYGTDLIVTRAGGGTANDAIATRTPLVCVQEPGHWQVEAIREALLREGLARSVTLESFRNNPLGVIEHELLAREEDNEKLRRRLESVKSQTEISGVHHILNYFLDPEGYYDDFAKELLFT